MPKTRNPIAKAVTRLAPRVVPSRKVYVRTRFPVEPERERVILIDGWSRGRRTNFEDR